MDQGTEELIQNIRKAQSHLNVLTDELILRIEENTSERAKKDEISKPEALEGLKKVTRFLMSARVKGYIETQEELDEQWEMLRRSQEMHVFIRSLKTPKKTIDILGQINKELES